jgi:hypothetical protein|tara:strand:- start:20 stop:331 length:312 start_codon:yes stop_codon:yes gene_type:complete
VKFSAIIVIITFVAWASYKTGYSSGVETAPEYAAEVQAATVQRNKQLELDLNAAASYQQPTVAECLPVLAGFDGDEISFCTDLLARYQSDEHDARELEYRSRD